MRRWAPATALHPNSGPNCATAKRHTDSVDHADAGPNTYPVSDRNALRLQLTPEGGRNQCGSSATVAECILLGWRTFRHRSAVHFKDRVVAEAELPSRCSGQRSSAFTTERPR